ncbi:MAG: hypothetical protein Aurels2KO_31680 [Aureliella sp.]
MINEQNEYAEPDSGLVARRDIRERLAIGLAGFCVVLALGAAATFQELSRQSNQKRRTVVAKLSSTPDSSFSENIALARSFLDDSDFGAAAATFTAALSVSQEDKESSEAFLGRGVANALNEDWEAAYEDFSESLTLSPKAPAPRLNLALAHERLGDPEQALDEIVRCLHIDPDNPYALGNASRLAFDLGKFERSAHYLSSLVVLYPDSAIVRLNRGLAFAQMGALGQATSDLRHPAVQQNATPAVQTILASLLARQGKPLESLESLRPVLDFSDVDAETQHASILLAAGALGALATEGRELGTEAQGALREFASKELPIENVSEWSAELESLERSFQSAEFCEISPLSFSTLDVAVSNRSQALAEDSFLEALKLVQVGDLYAAKASLTRCLRIEPRHFGARKRRAVIQLDIGQYADAITDVDYLLSEAPDDPELWTIRATAAARSKQFDSAIAALDHAVRLEQKNPVVYANRALTRFASKSNPELTISDIERAERLGLVTAELLHIKAAALMQLEDYEAALELQNSALEMEQGNPSFLVQRAKLHRHLENHQQSLSDAKAAADIAPGNVDAQVEIARAHLIARNWSALLDATDACARLGWDDDELRSMRQAAFEATNDYEGLVDVLSTGTFDSIAFDQQTQLVNAELRSSSVEDGIKHAVELVERPACPAKLIELAAQQAIEKSMPVESHVLLGKLLRDHDPGRTEYYIQMATCCQDIGGHSESLLWLAKYLERVPDSSRGWEMTGDAMVVQRNKTDALKCYTESLKFEPENRTALFSRAKLLVDVGKFALAKSDLKLLAATPEPDDDVSELLQLCDKQLLAGSQPAR